MLKKIDPDIYMSCLRVCCGVVSFVYVSFVSCCGIR